MKNAFTEAHFSHTVLLLFLFIFSFDFGECSENFFRSSCISLRFENAFDVRYLFIYLFQECEKHRFMPINCIRAYVMGEWEQASVPISLTSATYFYSSYDSKKYDQFWHFNEEIFLLSMYAVCACV